MLQDDSQDTIELNETENATEEVEKEPVAEVKKPEEDEFNKKFAALSRKEKEFRTERINFEREMANFKKQREEFESAKPKKPVEIPLEHKLKKDPLGTLKELGLDYETLTELALNDGKLSSDMQMKLMREELEKELENKYKSLEERLNSKEKEEEEKRFETIINNFKSEIDTVVKSDLDKYELINANSANDLIYEVIEEHHNETGNILDVTEAAEAVEAYLYEEAQKFLKLKKFAAKKEVAAEQKPEIKKTSATLSNDHSAESINNADRKLSAEESVQRAAAVLKWT